MLSAVAPARTATNQRCSWRNSFQHQRGFDIPQSCQGCGGCKFLAADEEMNCLDVQPARVPTDGRTANRGPPAQVDEPVSKCRSHPIDMDSWGRISLCYPGACPLSDAFHSWNAGYGPNFYRLTSQSNSLACRHAPLEHANRAERDLWAPPLRLGSGRLVNYRAVLDDQVRG